MTTDSNLRNTQHRLKQQIKALTHALKQTGVPYATDDPNNPTYFIGPPSPNSIRKGKYQRGDWVVLIATDPTTKAYVVKAVNDMRKFGERRP